MRRLAYSRQSVPLRHQNSPGGEGEDERVMKAIKGFARTYPAQAILSNQKNYPWLSVFTDRHKPMLYNH